MRKLIALCLLLTSPLFAQNPKVSEQGAASGTFIPAGTVMSYAGISAPPGWIFAYGQKLAQTGTYAKLYAAIGLSYCAAGVYPDHGDGTACGGSEFKVPDLRGRVIAGKDNMGGTAASRLTSAGSIDGTILGKAGGVQNHTIGSPNLPAHTHAAGTLSVDIGHSHTGLATNTDGTHIHTYTGTFNIIQRNASNASIVQVQSGAGAWGMSSAGAVPSSGVDNLDSGHSHGIPNITLGATGRTLSNSTADGGFANNAIQNLQPVTIINYIIKI